MKSYDLRQKLIDGTIHIIAQEGLDKATTKLIGTYTDTNEAYIYRCFKDKEDMFAKAFDSLDELLFEETMRRIDIMYMKNVPFESRCRMYFYAVWNLLLEDRDECLAYVRYYYSPYFTKYSAESHKERFMPLVEKFSGAFIEEANVWMILNHMLNVALDFAVKVHNNQMPNQDDYTEHVFRVIYASVKQYFKKIGKKSGA